MTITGNYIPVQNEPEILIEFTFDESQEGEEVCIFDVVISNQFGFELQSSFVDDNPCATLQSAQACDGIEGDANGKHLANVYIMYGVWSEWLPRVAFKFFPLS